MKTCSTCKQAKPTTGFYKDKRTPDGLKYQCKKCHMESSIRTRDEERKRGINREHMRRARLTDPEKFRQREQNYVRAKDDKYVARKLLNCAVRRGDIAKPFACEACGEEKKLTAHHEDYYKPYDVKWLCYECHGKLARKAS